MALQSGASPIPAGDTMPIPVTTIRWPSIGFPSLEEIEELLPYQRARDQRGEQLGLTFRIGTVHQLESRQGGSRLRACDGGGEPVGLLEHAVGSDAAVHEPDAMGLCRVDRLAAQDHLERLRPPHERGQAADAAQTRNEAERQPWEPETSAWPAHA